MYVTQGTTTTGYALAGMTLGSWVPLSSAANLYLSVASSGAGTVQAGGHAIAGWQISTSASSAGVVATGSFTIGDLGFGGINCPVSQNIHTNTNTGATFNAFSGGVSGTTGLWYSGGSLIGSNYWVMVNGFTSTAVGGTFTFNAGAGMTQGTWYNMASNQTFGVTVGGAPTGGWSITYNVSASSGGPILAQGVIYFS